jgi:hypothetical protein
VNIGNQTIRTTGVSVYDNNGNLRGSTIASIDAHGGWSGSITDLLPSLDAIEGYAIIDTAAGPFPSPYQAMVGISYSHGGDNAIVPALDDFARIRSGYAVLVASGGEYSSRLELTNPADAILQVHQDPNHRKALEQNGQRYVIEHYDRHQIARNFERLIVDIHGSDRGSALP